MKVLRLCIALALLASLAPVLGPESARAAQDRRPRIVGGTLSAPGAWPAHGFLDIDLGLLGRGECGGTLLSARWFITAAHCVTDLTTKLPRSPTQMRVGLGSTKRTALPFYGVGEVLVHPGWTIISDERNDLALLRLTRAAPERPLGLIAADETVLWAPATSAVVIGWGQVNASGPPSLPDDLMETRVPIVADAACASAYPRGVIDPSVMVCAGGDGAQDTCNGDSGGPLMVARRKRYALAGITSFGTESCAQRGVPGAYTRVGAPALNGWIRERITNVTLAPTASATAGLPVALSASARNPNPDVAGQAPVLRWDLDEDGAFDDAEGASINPTLAAGPREVSVEALFGDGDRAVADGVITVADPPPPPPPPPPPAAKPDRLVLPAKLEVTRAAVQARERRLSVLAPISRLASGRVAVRFEGAGERLRFTVPVDSKTGRVRVSRRITATAARLGTGIFTLTYPGDADTQPQQVRLRAGRVPANLVAGRPRITAGGRLVATGTIARRARGIVHLELTFLSGGQVRALEVDASIEKGRYRIDEQLEAPMRALIAGRQGAVHSYTLFTGYLPARMRGELRSLQVLGAAPVGGLLRGGAVGRGRSGR